MSRRGLALGQQSESRIGKKRTDPEADLDITPMIDVTFLLLIFFMVTSTMSSQKELDVPKAKHGVNLESGAAILIVIEASNTVGGAPLIFLDGREATLKEVADYVNEGMKNDKHDVVVKAGREVPHGFVQQVFRAANVAEGLNFSLGVEDKTGS